MSPGLAQPVAATVPPAAAAYRQHKQALLTRIVRDGGLGAGGGFGGLQQHFGIGGAYRIGIKCLVGRRRGRHHQWGSEQNGDAPARNQPRRPT